MSSLHPLAARYADAVDDPRSLSEALHAPLPGAFWIHEGKAPREAILANLDAHGLARTPIAWTPQAWRVSPEAAPAKTLAYLAGGLYVQEEIAMTAVLALGVVEGDLVLDMCAAPGGKSAQASLAAGPEGRVFANESNLGRMAALGANVNRLGLTNVIALRGDGREVPAPYGSVDRVICDVPCSGEGTARKLASDWGRSDEDFRWRLPAIQKQLLRRALHQTRPGGWLVYSTCTFAPEENEAVLHASLGELGEIVAFPWEARGLVASPGLPSWRGEAFRADVANAARFWPHHNDTGGFFVALIRRTSEPTRKRDRVALRNETAPAGAGSRWRKDALAAGAFRGIAQRYGLPEDFLSPYSVWEKGNGKAWLCGPGRDPFPGMVPDSLGLAAFRGAARGESDAAHADPAPGTGSARVWATSYFLQLAGRHATRNFVDLDHEQGLSWARGEDTHVRPSQRDSARDGQVIVRCGGLVLGHGALEAGLLRSQVPGGLRWN